MSGHTDSPPPLAEQARELLLRVRELEATVARVRELADAWSKSTPGESLASSLATAAAAIRVYRALDGDQ